MTEKKMQSSKEKLQSLRDELKKQSIDGFIIPRGDEFLGEYVPPSAERLAWISGFTGSSGTAVVTASKAVLVTDGRYTFQAGKQLDRALFEVSNMEDKSLAVWLKEKAGAGEKIGFDPRLHTEKQIADLQSELDGSGIDLVPLSVNPVDTVWQGRPSAPMAPVELFPEAIAGKSWQEKRDEVVSQLKENQGAAFLLAKPESIAWLLNIRGGDVPHTPVALSQAIIRENGDIDWFIEPAKVPPPVLQHLGSRVRIKDPQSLRKELDQLAAGAGNRPVFTDKNQTPVWFKMEFEKQGAVVRHMEDPCILLRACKTPAEQQAIIKAHIRDGVAVTRFLKWADENLPQGGYSELDVVAKLREFREYDPDFRDDSFDTIAGWAGNGAIIHYRATADSNASIKLPGILLLDSGAQYSDGTTDITRTISVGLPTTEMRRNFTLVLKGHIGIATARFPEGTTGAQIDYAARAPLWQENKDFDHGTGHGVGCFLSVHEEAATISKRGSMPFKPGMLISNEPGFYKEGEYGIRIENLVLVKAAGKRQDTGRAVGMMAFETVTLAPIDRRLIEPCLLDDKEVAWLNSYHERVRLTLSPHLDPDEQQWLIKATKPIGRGGAGPECNKGQKPGSPEAPAL